MIIRERDIFMEALAKTKADQAAYLDSACGDDRELRHGVDQLLMKHGQEESFFLDRPLPDVDFATDPWANESLGTMIGPYRLLEKLGDGGMGVVYLAEQSEPVQRKVALKVIKPGMDSRQIIVRFEAERQALAMMDHVNIARVLDAGTTGGTRANSDSDLSLDPSVGRPYFVMELVHGVPITKYCDDHQLTPRERLELFVSVCLAIQHAHQKGIIHRDIKPSNVLVTLYDGKPVPKVIDFGVAKATEQKLTVRTLFTNFGTLVGTPQYMSPEQADMGSLGVDTRSDIYSLGVLLYELLTGGTPLTRVQIREAAFNEILRLIQEEDPPKPSTRLLNSGEELASISAQRHMEPSKLTKVIRGELDWIAMKCLEKDRNRRYETANSLMMDVERYLRDEPVLACPPSTTYRFYKFVRRNKGAISIALTAALGVFLAVIMLVLSNIWITKETAQKELALQDKDAALAAAKASESHAKAKEALANAAQNKADENLQDARAAVDQMLTRVADRLAGVPQMEHVRRELLEGALEFYRSFLEKERDDPVIRQETAWAYRRLADLQLRLGAYVEAEKCFRKTFGLFEELAAHSPIDPATRIALVPAHLQFARLLSELGKPEEADEQRQRAAQIAEQLVLESPEDQLRRDLLVTMNINLVHLPTNQQEAMLRRSLTLTRSTYLLGHIYMHLAALCAKQGRYPEAQKEYLECVANFETVASTTPSSSAQFDLASVLAQLANVMVENGQSEKAEVMIRRAIAIWDKLAIDYPAFHHHRMNQAETHHRHANLLKKLDRTADAEQAYRRAVELYEKLAVDFADIPSYQQLAFDHRLGLGRFLVDAGQPYDAQQIYGDSVALVGALKADAPARMKHWQGFVRTHIELGRLLASSGSSKAEESYRQAMAISEELESELGDKDELRRDVAQSHLDAAWILRLDRRFAEAEQLYRWAIGHYTRLASKSPQSQLAREDLATAHFALADHYRWAPGRLDDAETNFQQVLAQYEKLSADFPSEPRYRIVLADVRERLASVLLFQGRFSEAYGRLRDALTLSRELADKYPADPAVRMPLAMGSRHWGEALRGLGRMEEAESAFRSSLNTLEKLAADFPQESWYPLEQAVTCQMLAALLARQCGPPLRGGEPRRGAAGHIAAAEFYHRDVEIFEQLIAKFPSDPSYRTRLADAHREWAVCLQEFGQTQEATATFALAIANYTRATELGSWDIYGVWYPLALLHLKAGQTSEYRALCKTLLTRSGHSPAKNPEFWVVAICKLGPDAADDLTPLVQIAEELLALDPHNTDAVGFLGDTLYRKGDLDAAVAKLEASIQANPGVGVHWRKLFLAMAYHRLGRAAESQRLLEETSQWIAKNAQEQLAEDADLKQPLPWCLRLDLQLLCEEAEKLLQQRPRE